MIDKVILITNDQKEFEVSKKIVRFSGTLLASLDEDNEEDLVKIPLPNVDASTMTLVLKFCELSLEEQLYPYVAPFPSGSRTCVYQSQYVSFVNSMSLEIVNDLLLAADYLDILPLLNLCCERLSEFLEIERNFSQIPELYFANSKSERALQIFIKHYFSLEKLHNFITTRSIFVAADSFNPRFFQSYSHVKDHVNQSSMRTEFHIFFLARYLSTSTLTRATTPLILKELINHIFHNRVNSPFMSHLYFYALMEERSKRIEQPDLSQLWSSVLHNLSLQHMTYRPAWKSFCLAKCKETELSGDIVMKSLWKTCSESEIENWNYETLDFYQVESQLSYLREAQITQEYLVQAYQLMNQNYKTSDENLKRLIPQAIQCVKISRVDTGLRLGIWCFEKEGNPSTHSVVRPLYRDVLKTYRDKYVFPGLHSIIRFAVAIEHFLRDLDRKTIYFDERIRDFPNLIQFTCEFYDYYKIQSQQLIENILKTPDKPETCCQKVTKMERACTWFEKEISRNFHQVGDLNKLRQTMHEVGIAHEYIDFFNSMSEFVDNYSEKLVGYFSPCLEACKIIQTRGISITNIEETLNNSLRTEINLSYSDHLLFYFQRKNQSKAPILFTTAIDILIPFILEIMKGLSNKEKNAKVGPYLESIFKILSKPDDFLEAQTDVVLKVVKLFGRLIDPHIGPEVYSLLSSTISSIQGKIEAITSNVIDAATQALELYQSVYTDKRNSANTENTLDPERDTSSENINVVKRKLAIELVMNPNTPIPNLLQETLLHYSVGDQSLGHFHYLCAILTAVGYSDMKKQSPMWRNSTIELLKQKIKNQFPTINQKNAFLQKWGELCEKIFVLIETGPGNHSKAFSFNTLDIYALLFLSGLGMEILDNQCTTASFSSWRSMINRTLKAQSSRIYSFYSSPETISKSFDLIQEYAISLRQMELLWNKLIVNQPFYSRRRKPKTENSVNAEKYFNLALSSANTYAGVNKIQVVRWYLACAAEYCYLMGPGKKDQTRLKRLLQLTSSSVDQASLDEILAIPSKTTRRSKATGKENDGNDGGEEEEDDDEEEEDGDNPEEEQHHEEGKGKEKEGDELSSVASSIIQQTTTRPVRNKRKKMETVDEEEDDDNDEIDEEKEKKTTSKRLTGRRVKRKN